MSRQTGEPGGTADQPTLNALSVCACARLRRLLSPPHGLLVLAPGGSGHAVSRGLTSPYTIQNTE